MVKWFSCQVCALQSANYFIGLQFDTLVTIPSSKGSANSIYLFLVLSTNNNQQHNNNTKKPRCLYEVQVRKTCDHAVGRWIVCAMEGLEMEGGLETWAEGQDR